MPRFILLEHVGAPDDPAGIHVDLLLEADGGLCRTWRLAALPRPGAGPVDARPLAPHRVAWLDHEAGDVSGGRGFARRIAAGVYEPAVAGVTDEREAISVTLRGDRFTGRLHLVRAGDRWCCRIVPPDLRR